MWGILLVPRPLADTQKAKRLVFRRFDARFEAQTRESYDSMVYGLQCGGDDAVMMMVMMMTMMTMLLLLSLQLLCGEFQLSSLSQAQMEEFARVCHQHRLSLSVSAALMQGWK